MNDNTAQLSMIIQPNYYPLFVKIFCVDRLSMWYLIQHLLSTLTTLDTNQVILAVAIPPSFLATNSSQTLTKRQLRAV